MGRVKAQLQLPGVATSDVNALIKDFEGARKMMRTMMGGKRMPGMMKMPAGAASKNKKR